MKELVIVSGKGGTGKTSITAAFAFLAENSLLCDADVDAADLHLLMAPEIQQRTDFMGGSIAKIRKNDCSECGKCLDICRFSAISNGYVVDKLACEGCGVCVDLCPEKAIDFLVQKCGEWYISMAKFGVMIHARLGIAEENSGKLVSLVRNHARKLAEENGNELILTDGPPGIGCPVIAAIGGASALLIVAEPTVSGLHDMIRVADLAVHFKIPGLICVNKYDLNEEMTAKIEAVAEERNIINVGRIPFDSQFTNAMVSGQNVLEYQENSNTSNTIRLIWGEIIQSSAMSMRDLKDLTIAIKK